jgi:hypothetical protein
MIMSIASFAGKNLARLLAAVIAVIPHLIDIIGYANSATVIYGFFLIGD